MIMFDTIADLVDFVEAHTGLDAIDIITMPAAKLATLIRLLSVQIIVDDAIDALIS